MRFVGRCYRVHDRKWSFTPLSGEGAALTGGRFNRKREPTLYLSLDVMTSFGECTQGFTARLAPLTMCEYDVDCEDIADLRDDAAREANATTLEELGCAWLRFQRAGKTAPSWLVANRLRASGFAGILVPSFAPGATDANINLVLWRWGPVPPHRIAVYDPSGRLPRNQLSWLEGSQESLSKLSFGISDGYLPKIPEEGIRRTPAAKDGRLFSENSKNSPRRDETFERS